MNFKTAKKSYCHFGRISVLLFALAICGCNSSGTTGKQQIETKTQDTGKQQIETKTQDTGKQQSETKTKEIGNATVVKKLVGTPETKESDRIAGKYVNEKNTAARLEISNNGTYLFQVNGQYIGGNYVLNGDNITLFGPGKPFEGKFNGDYLISSTGGRFKKVR